MSENAARRGRNDPSIAMRINWLSNRLVTSASATYGQVGVGFLDARLISLLGRRPEITAARVSEILGVDAAAVSRAVKSLKARKLVAEAGGTSRSLSLTDEGRVLGCLTGKIADEREMLMLRGFTDRETDQLLSLLDRLLGNMGEVAAIAERVGDVIGEAELSD